MGKSSIASRVHQGGDALAEKRPAQDNLDNSIKLVKDTKKEKRREVVHQTQGHTSAQTRLNKLNAQ